MNILIVDDDDQVRLLVSTCLENQCKATVYESASVQDAIAIIKQQPALDCIVSDYNMPNGSGADLFRYLQSTGSKLPFLLCTSEDLETLPEFKNADLAGYIHKSDVIRSLPKLINNLKNSRVNSTGETAYPYCRIKLEALLRSDILSCDVYVKLSGLKYVRVLSKGDGFTHEDYLKYQKRNIQHLYLKKEDLTIFLNTMLVGIAGVEKVKSLNSPAALRSFADQVDNTALKQELNELASSLETDVYSIELHESIHEKTRQAIKAFGITPEVDNLIKGSINLVMQALSKEARFEKLLEKITLNEDQYISSHSILLSSLSCSIASLMNWSSDITRYKLILASFLHDITLEDHHLATFQSVESVILDGSFTGPAIKAFAEHPKAAVQLAKEMSAVPADVDRILLQHHERPDGSGFPNRSPHQHLTPLSCIFIVAHDLVHFMFDQKQNPIPFEQFVVEFSPQYQVGYFKKILVSLSLALQNSAISK